MTDRDDAIDGGRPTRETTSDATASEMLGVASAYKILGELDADDGVGVVGRNTATSGTPVGVRGAVPNNADGYGFETPDDAYLGGDLVTDGRFEVVTDGVPVVRVESDDGSGAAGNVRFGHSENSVFGVGVTVSGGGFDDGNTFDSHYVARADFATVGGGRSNQINAFRNSTDSEAATIAGGQNNRVDSSAGATVGGGRDNAVTDSAAQATVAGGKANTATGRYAAVGGGSGNDATDFSSTASGGFDNAATRGSSTVGGGFKNTAEATAATVGGGDRNDAHGQWSTIAGGGPSDPTDATTNNVVYDDYGTIGGGAENRAGTEDGTRTSATHATVAGGGENTAGEFYAAVGGGRDNTANGDYATVAGGQGNDVTGLRGTVAGGYNNVAGGSSAAVGGGVGNRANGNDAVVPGGGFSYADGDYSFAAGRQAKATTDGQFVWADDTSADFSPSGKNTWSARATGGVQFVTAVNGTTPTASVSVGAGGNAWSSMSARAAKENVRPVDTEAVLDGVRALDVAEWNYRSQDGSVRHLGPFAGPFQETFGLGEDPERIATVDADGVLFAAIKGLADRADAREDRIDALEDENERLRERNARLEDRLSTVETHLDPDDGGPLGDSSR